MPTALELTREGWKPYLEAARRRPAPPEPTPAERRERARLLARVGEAAQARSKGVGPGEKDDQAGCQWTDLSDQGRSP